MDDLTLRNNLDSTFVSRSVEIQYPYLFVPKYSNEIALLVTCVAKGDLPIVVRDGDVLKQIGTCAKSAFELRKFLEVYSEITIYRSADEAVHLKTLADVMDALSWMVS